MIASNKMKYSHLMFFVLLVVTFFFLGNVQGYFQGSSYKEMKYCDNKIYPYGCEFEENSTHCVVFECDGFLMHPSAFCFDMNYSSSFRDELLLDLFGLTFLGCPGSVESIGINSVTGHRNWKYNKIDEEMEVRLMLHEVSSLYRDGVNKSNLTKPKGLYS